MIFIAIWRLQFELVNTVEVKSFEFYACVAGEELPVYAFFGGVLGGLNINALTVRSVVTRFMFLISTIRKCKPRPL